jgi:hypothetical protein
MSEVSNTPSVFIDLPEAVVRRMILESDEGEWSASTRRSIGLWESMIAVAADLLGRPWVSFESTSGFVAEDGDKDDDSQEGRGSLMGRIVRRMDSFWISSLYCPDYRPRQTAGIMSSSSCRCQHQLWALRHFNRIPFKINK